jgi:hypothetical protein
MARLPVRIVYKFYGCGIPQKWAIPYLTLSDIRAVSSRVKDGQLWMEFGVCRRHHIGLHILRLINKIQISIHVSFGLYLKWLNTHVCEIEEY